VRLQVVPELVQGDMKGVQHLLGLRVCDLAVREDLADIVDMSLDGVGFAFLRSFHHQDHADYLGGRRDVE
jgi:hypothetical protein